jgi:hypothetical protein
MKGAALFRYLLTTRLGSRVIGRLGGRRSYRESD